MVRGKSQLRYVYLADYNCFSSMMTKDFDEPCSSTTNNSLECRSLKKFLTFFVTNTCNCMFFYILVQPWPEILMVQVAVLGTIVTALYWYYCIAGYFCGFKFLLFKFLQYVYIADYNYVFLPTRKIKSSRK